MLALDQLLATRLRPIVNFFPIPVFVPLLQLVISLIFGVHKFEVSTESTQDADSERSAQ